MPITTRGYAMMFEWSFRGVTPPANFYLALVTAATPPTHATKFLGDLVEIADGNGYAEGGYELDPDNANFVALVEDDTDRFTDLVVKTIAWTAGGGDIPDSGDPARYLVLTDDEAVVGDRNVLAYWTLGAPRTALDGQALTISGIRLKIQGGAVLNSIQRGTITITGTQQSATATISSVNTAKSRVRLLGCSSDNAANADIGNQYLLWRIELTNATTVTIYRAGSSDPAGTLTIGYEVEESF